MNLSCKLNAYTFVIFSLLAAYSVAQTAYEIGFNGTTTSCTSADTNLYYLTTPVYPTSGPAPLSLSVSYSEYTGVISFQVQTLYVPSDSRLLLDFSPFTTVTARGSCTNYGASSFSGPFSGWWNHPSNAAGVQNTTVGSWATAPIGCSKFQYTGSFTPGSLLNCSYSDGSKQITIYQSPSTGLLVISGFLYVSLVQPYSLTGGESAGYIYESWPMPFQVYYGNTITTVGDTSATIELSLTTYQVFLNSNGDLVVYIVVVMATDATQYPAGMVFASGVSGPVAMTTSFAMPLAVNTPTTQTIMYTSAYVPVTGIYDGIYAFRFTLYGCTCAGVPQCPVYTTVTLDVPITMRVYQSTNTTGMLEAGLTKYTNSSFTQTVNSTFSVYYEGQRFCVLDKLINLDLQTLNLYNMTITSVMLCNPNTPSTAVVYDGQTNFGCIDQTQRAYLVINAGVVQGVDPDYYSTTLYQYFSAGAAGLCINTRISMMDPLTSTQYAASGTQYMQVQAMVTLIQSRSKRSTDDEPTYAVLEGVFLFEITNTPSGGNATTFIVPNRGHGGSGSISGAGLAGIIIGIFAFVAIAMVLVIFFTGYHRRDKKYKKMKKDKIRQAAKASGKMKKPKKKSHPAEEEGLFRL